MPNEKLYWHFCWTDRRLGYGDGRQIVVGETLAVDCEPILCIQGLHASERAIDALEYADHRPVICRVRIGGTVIVGDDKVSATERTCLAMADATKVLHEFACVCAEHALLREREAGREPDARCWAAIEVKRRWIGGEATDEELTAARNAASAASAAAWNAASAAARDASAAAWNAASAAAWAAAWAAASAASAAARAAARDAARDAAWNARDAAWNAARNARAAARDAAWYAARNARAAASAAAWYAARDAEREWQNQTLTAMLEKLLGLPVSVEA